MPSPWSRDSAARAPDLALTDPPHGIQIRPVTVTRLDRVPLAGPVLEPPTPLGHIGTVLGVAGPVLGLDHPEAMLRKEGEGLAVVLHSARVGRGSDGVLGVSPIRVARCDAA